LSERAIAFLKIGSFSHTNAAVLEMLRTGFPEHTIDVIDVGRLVRRDAPAVAIGVLALMRTYGPRTLLHPGTRWRAFFGTPWCFHTVRRMIRARLGERPYAFTLQTQSLFDGSRPGTPHFVYTDHTARMNRDYPPDADGRTRIEARLSERWIELEAEVYRHATRVLTQTERAARSVVEDYGIPPARVRCVYAGGHVRPRSARPQPAPGKRILYVGTSWERKGGPELLAAFARVRERHPDAELVLIGPTPRLAAPNVHAAGVVPLAELPHWLESASIFCVPTRREPLGFVFIEAAHHGLPIVATRVGSLPELVRDGETGRLVDVGDVEALADVLCELLDDPVRRAELGARGRAHLGATWNWENAARHLLAAVREGLGQPQVTRKRESHRRPGA